MKYVEPVEGNKEPKVTELGFTEVVNLVERLTFLKIGARICDRIRFDDEFAREAAGILRALNQLRAGKRFVLKLNDHYTRLDLNQMLKSANIGCLRDNIILDLRPVQESSNQRDLLHQSYEMEWFVATFYAGENVEEITFELDARGLVPCDTDEGLLFVQHFPREDRERSIVVLDSWRQLTIGKEFPSFGHTMNGFPIFSLVKDHDINYRYCNYLCKRKAVVADKAQPDLL